MKKYKIIVTLFIVLIICFWFTNITVYAKLVETDPKTDGKSKATKAADSSSDGTAWWGQANSFLSGYGGTGEVTKYFEGLTSLVTLIKTVGNMIFFAVTVVLGVKYIWGGVESKSSVKESLTTLIVAALVFYGWNTITALFKTGEQLSFVSGSAEGTASNIYSTVLYIANFFAVGGIVYIGVRYMMAGAEGRAELKTKGVPIVLGLVMVYSTLTFLQLIRQLI